SWTHTRAILVVKKLRLLALALPIAVLVSGIVVLPAWVAVLPRTVQRAITETILRAVLVGYMGLVLVVVIGTPLSLCLMARVRRRGAARPRVLRALSVTVACLIAMVILESGAAAWRGWLHRFPSLPLTFEESPPDEYRIVVLGGSSALGEPFRPWLSIGQI